MRDGPTGLTLKLSNVGGHLSGSGTHIYSQLRSEATKPTDHRHPTGAYIPLKSPHNVPSGHRTHVMKAQQMQVRVVAVGTVSDFESANSTDQRGTSSYRLPTSPRSKRTNTAEEHI
jgi:hypothetical protein